MTEQMKHSVRGGMSSFVKDGQVFVSDSAGCLRKALLRSKGIEEPIGAKTKKVFHLGAVNEEIWKTWLTEAGRKFVEEKEFCEIVTDDSNFVGHSDFVVEMEDGSHLCYELKSVSSKNTYKKIFKENKPKISNLAQCVNYMVSQETNRGRLCYTSYIAAIEYSEFDGYDLEEINDLVYSALEQGKIETKIFEVEIKEDGKVFLDGVYSEFDVQHVLDHRRATADVLENNKIYRDRPQTTDNSDPCHFCPFKVVCDKNITDTQEFLKLAKEAVKL